MQELLALPKFETSQSQPVDSSPLSIHHLPRSQPASGLRRQLELCQQAVIGDFSLFPCRRILQMVISVVAVAT